jgi:hypothetical protein
MIASVSYKVVVRLIDRIGAEQRHDNRLHQDFERAAEHQAEDQAADPALGPDVADLAPRRARPLSPHQHENGAEGRDHEIAGEDDEDREDSERAESAQGRGERIVDWKCGARRDAVGARTHHGPMM